MYLLLCILLVLQGSLCSVGLIESTNSLPVLPGCLGADLVSVSSPGLFGHIEATAVSCEAGVGPVGVVETKQATVLGVTRVLDGDGARHHGDNTAAAGIPLSLNRARGEENE